MSKQLKHKQQLRIIVQYSPLDHLTMMNYNAGIILKKKYQTKISNWNQSTRFALIVSVPVDPDVSRTKGSCCEYRKVGLAKEIVSYRITKDKQKKKQLVNRKLPLKVAEGSYKTLLPQGPQNHQLNYFLKLHLLNKVYLNIFILLPT